MTDPAITLRELIEARLAAHEALHVEHTAAHDREHKATEVALSKAEVATQTALTRAQEVVDARFETQNGWRASIDRRERDYLDRLEWRVGHEAVIARLDKLEDSEIARATREAERERSLTRTMALIGLAASVGGFLLSLLTRMLGIGA